MPNGATNALASRSFFLKFFLAWRIGLYVKRLAESPFWTTIFRFVSLLAGLMAQDAWYRAVALR